jgi:hypothetical protein
MALIGGRERQHPCRQPSFVAGDVEPDTRRRKEFAASRRPFMSPDTECSLDPVK